MSTDKAIFGYYINLDERGDFYADVRDAAGKTIFEVRAGSSLGEDESSIFDDGFMRNKDDVDGLTEYLQSLSIIPVDARVLPMTEFETALEERATLENAAKAYEVAIKELGIHKGSSPERVERMYAARDAYIDALVDRDVIGLSDLKVMERTGRVKVASEHWQLCDADAQGSLLRDEHPHVRSCAVLSQAGMPANAEPDDEPEDNRIFTVSVTYEVVTEESAENGDAEERGYEIEREDMDYEDFCRLLKDRNYSQPSSSHITDRMWFSTPDAEQGRAFFEKGESKYYAVHLHSVDGQPPALEDYAEVARLAGAKVADMDQYKRVDPDADGPDFRI